MSATARPRRAFLKAAGALTLAGVSGPVRTDASPSLCGPESGTRLLPPGAGGWFGTVDLAAGPVELAAQAVAPTGGMPWTIAYAVVEGDAVRLAPTFVTETGTRARITLRNRLDAPTIAHWHGLANDVANDGAGFVLAAPGATYAYDFAVRNRAGLHWYHPHPHGTAAGQLYSGLLGLIRVDDDDERRLRRALGLEWGVTELPLVLQDRRDAIYGADGVDRHRGLLGHEATVNGCTGAWLDAATRRYRLRILNASSARTYRLALTRDGQRLPFHVLGTDGGLLAAPARCMSCFLSPAERVDLLVDLRDVPLGASVALETLDFDPMHAPIPEGVESAPPAHGNGAGPPASAPVHTSATAPVAGTVPGRARHAWPEGGRRVLATFRVRSRVEDRGRLPEALSTLPPVDVAGAPERALRMGFNKGRWRINDRVYAMHETPIELPRRTTEVWLLRNYHTSMPHAMHVHGTHFRVLERETSPEQVNALAVDERGRLATDLGLKDTVLVWPGESVRIAVRFDIDYDGPQTYLLHCHNMEHEDGGMMLGVRVT
jgi:suppressor of ftsI/bilirubin oxidase